MEGKSFKPVYKRKYSFPLIFIDYVANKCTVMIDKGLLKYESSEF